MTEVWLLGKGKISNFGDGDAHRVTIHVQRGAHEPGVLGTSPLLKPGDALEFELQVHADDYDTTTIWATWTSPPIRRRRERTSERILVKDHMDHSTQVEMRRDARRKIAAFVQHDLEQTESSPES